MSRYDGGGRATETIPRIPGRPAGDFPEEHQPQPGREPKTTPGFLDRIIRPFYENSLYHILQLDLYGIILPSCEYDPDIFLRELSTGDIEAATNLYPELHRIKKMRLFVARLKAGYIGVGAWQNGMLVGINWVSCKGVSDYLPGLDIKLTPGSCLSLDLYEHEMYQNQGIDLATLTFAISRSKEMGFGRQYLAVKSDDYRMLDAVTRLIGFKKVGEIEARKILGKKKPRWRLGNHRGQDRLLLL